MRTSDRVFALPIVLLLIGALFSLVYIKLIKVEEQV